MLTIKLELDESVLRALVKNAFERKLGDISLEDSDVQIQVKSKQNFKSEWEEASFRAVVNKTLVNFPKDEP